MFSRQCQLVRNLPDGEVRLTTWLPAEYAILGKILMLKELGKWENGWLVKDCGEIADQKAVHRMSWNHTRQRRASDI